MDQEEPDEPDEEEDRVLSEVHMDAPPDSKFTRFTVRLLEAMNPTDARGLTSIQSERVGDGAHGGIDQPQCVGDRTQEGVYQLGDDDCLPEVQHGSIEDDGTGNALSQLSFDSDGDLDVERPKCQKLVLHIPHSMVLLIDTFLPSLDTKTVSKWLIPLILQGTPLVRVGEQIWTGALILADYIASNRQLLKGKTILELGAGTGFVSLVVAHMVDDAVVYCTDTGDSVLANCREALATNPPSGSSVMHVRELDWTRPVKLPHASIRACTLPI